MQPRILECSLPGCQAGLLAWMSSWPTLGPTRPAWMSSRPALGPTWPAWMSSRPALGPTRPAWMSSRPAGRPWGLHGLPNCLTARPQACMLACHATFTAACLPWHLYCLPVGLALAPPPPPDVACPPLCPSGYPALVPLLWPLWHTVTAAHRQAVVVQQEVTQCWRSAVA